MSSASTPTRVLTVYKQKTGEWELKISGVTYAGTLRYLKEVVTRFNTNTIDSPVTTIEKRDKNGAYIGMIRIKS